MVLSCSGWLREVPFCWASLHGSPSSRCMAHSVCWLSLRYGTLGRSTKQQPAPNAKQEKFDQHNSKER
jgi:hypothetical protein